MASEDVRFFASVDQVKNALETCLESVDSEGSFATSGRCEDINPGLMIEGLGRFGVPLSQDEVRRIIDSSHQAPFGKGSETIVDTAVRNTWEIDAARIGLHHPKWSQYERTILGKVCSELGIPGCATFVQAQLYKLWVYQEGAMLTPHKDTEKAPRMFGTMVICLPKSSRGR